jgi:hypothetical protein
LDPNVWPWGTELLIYLHGQVNHPRTTPHSLHWALQVRYCLFLFS